jgi:hypothetical protein
MCSILTNKTFLIKLNSFTRLGYLNAKYLSTQDLNKPEINDFKKYLKHKILMKGPLTVAEYMKEALGNPKWVIFHQKSNHTVFDLIIRHPFLIT